MECKQLKYIEEGVKVWCEDIVIPTYPVGRPDKNPMFLEKRVYQGSSGKVYPHHIVDKIYDEPEDKVYHAICLENKYLFVMILPELGGRIQRAYDKTNGYDFIYYNQVIKPALVGLAGPWISGGIEFNWPQHHRPSTFDPVDYSIAENPDGSCSAMLSEIENMFRTKGMATITLFPDKAYIKIDARLYNRTSLPQTFLWWANPAVSVNDNTKSIFPPDVTAVMDHGKRDVSKFPIATGVYYKYDYSAGVDISRYKNIPVPTSYMAYSSKYDFIGGYDFGKDAGLLHVADHHISPGKKQWTWGCGDFGKAWERNLTDEDGPYIELMTGCYTDNQPDFSWLMPYEEKTFTQYFMPYKKIGEVKNANKEAALNLSFGNRKAKVSVYTTDIYNNARVVLFENGKEIFSEIVSLSPVNVYETEISVQGYYDLELKLYDSSGRMIISYRPEKNEEDMIPDPAQAVPLPQDVETNEDLYLYGLHLEQYRHATYLPDDYYLEGLRRDPTDARINNAYGLLLLRRGKFEEAEQYFKNAIKKLTRSNPNPYDGEPYYNLGVCQRLMGKNEQAYDSFYKATWNDAQKEKSYYHLACICTEKGDLDTASEHIEQSLIRNLHNMKARMLKTALLRMTGRKKEAIDFAKETLSIDPMDFAASYELTLLDTENREKYSINKRIKDNPNWVIELAIEYADAGLYDEAIDILKIYCEDRTPYSIYPMVYYYLAHYSQCKGSEKEASRYRQLASKADSSYCFPHRCEDIIVLRSSLDREPEDAKGWYYLGNLWYDKRQYSDAISAWEKSRDIDPQFPTAHRNLALAYFNKLGDAEKARREMEKAFELDKSDARVLMELNQLYKKLGIGPEIRQKLLEENMETTVKRDDLFCEYIAIKNISGRHEEALELINGRHFHPWEGGEGKVSYQYICALTEIAKKKILSKQYKDALELLERATVYPENLGEGKLIIAKENDTYYWMGVAYEGLGEYEKARKSFEKASIGDDEPAGMMYYNDQPPEMIFYQGLAFKKLGKDEEAKCCFEKLITFAEEHISDEVRIDFFAVSLPDLLIFDEDLNKKNRIHCLFMSALGFIGKGDLDSANKILNVAYELDSNHQGIIIHKDYLEKML